MSSLVETGGTFSITSYNLQMRSSSTDSWVSIVGGSTSYTLLTYTKTGLTQGVDYQFRIQASNSFGWGPFSDVVTIRSDNVPAQIQSVTTTIESIYARISWSPTSNNYGSPVLAYRVQVLAIDGVTFTESPTCNGSDSNIVSSLTPSCLISIAELRSAPYSLTQGVIIKAIVQARNIEGWSPMSQVNTIGA